VCRPPVQSGLLHAARAIELLLPHCCQCATAANDVEPPPALLLLLPLLLLLLQSTNLMLPCISTVLPSGLCSWCHVSMPTACRHQQHNNFAHMPSPLCPAILATAILCC
jgi:hypothetical protein